MSLASLVFFSLGIFTGTLGLIISVSYLAYKSKNAKYNKYYNGVKNY